MVTETDNSKWFKKFPGLTTVCVEDERIKTPCNSARFKRAKKSIERRILRLEPPGLLTLNCRLFVNK